MSARRRRGRDRNVKLSASGHNRYNKPDYTHLRLDPVKNMRMHTVWLGMCSKGVPMARGGGGYITGNGLGQGFNQPWEHLSSRLGSL